ncbi:MAG: hypothetical protein KM296_07505 [Brockia lithotrophica]|nr:hypothetical protein [Brockia lithotrophica]
MTEQERTPQTPPDEAGASRAAEAQKQEEGVGERVNTSPTDALPAGAGSVGPAAAYESVRGREEFAAEMAPRAEAGTAFPAEERREEAGFGLGALALALSLLSLFFAPYLLGAGGVLLGYLAYHQGSRSLGAWAMGLGLVSIVVAFFLGPMIRAW